MTLLIKVTEAYEIKLDQIIDSDWYLNSYTKNNRTNYYGNIQSTENNDFICVSSLSSDNKQRIFMLTPKKQGNYIISFKNVSSTEANIICNNKLKLKQFSYVANET